ncbi:glycosyl hydrolase [Mucilaginibacter antarcticus]|uniref:glycosyl hydrolase n=1 Tax=Mucilaginibacter antarcticus TaxID=1855725 RepID=UPI0036369B88
MRKPSSLALAAALLAIFNVLPLLAQVAPTVPDKEELNRKFGNYDATAFKSPQKVYYPETWFHFIGGNVSKKGITADLEAIARSGISGIQLFHGQFGGPWPGVEPQITCLSPLWEDAVKHAALECKRLGLKFTMQNCPGWAMAGGPWITPTNAMRHLAWSRTDVKGGKLISQHLEQPQPSKEDWRDYKDITVLTFPTPADDTGLPLFPVSVKGSEGVKWADLLVNLPAKAVRLKPAAGSDPYWVEINFADTVTVRTIELPSVNSFIHAWIYEPGVKVKVQAILPNGKIKEILNDDIPASNWQDNRPLSLALPEVKGAKTFKVWIENKHDMQLNYIRFFTAARKNNWEAEAGWTLRKIDRSGTTYAQSAKSYIDPARIVDITKMVDAQGNIKWTAPIGNWTILRIGHVNTGKKNGPAPPEGTGWECDKLSEAGADAHFAGYIGRLSGSGGPLDGGLLTGMLMDSWECETQTWTNNMESEFARITTYPLRKWLPAVFGYVLKDQETTFRFLHDWRGAINDLHTHKFFGRMAQLAKGNHLSVSYETAAGDVTPTDILEYYKFADVPMCEFWQPFSNGYVGTLNFKPVKPAASAARIYGKPRLAAEAFTSFELTWDEQWQMLKDVANVNSVEGVTHLVYHTYTHNPINDSIKPGTSFGAGIGTPFLRGQTWWQHMPAFNSYFARLSYMLERGKPVSDVLWYLGDEIDHKPDQNALFPAGYKYDYCNPDVLLNRLSVNNGALVTPEGIQYKVLWLPETTHMLPQTLEKLAALIRSGATIVGNAPKSIVTLSGGANAQARFNSAVKSIWSANAKGLRQIGKGVIISGTTLANALNLLKMTPDVTTDNALWTHRRTEGADWYFVTAPKGQAFNGTIDFKNTGSIELWDPVMGTSKPIFGTVKNGRTQVALDLAQAGACFVVFNHNKAQTVAAKLSQSKTVATIPLTEPWSLAFPGGWDAPRSVQITELIPWKDLDTSTEGKAFSGTAIYSTSFNIDKLDPSTNNMLDLGRADMIARVTLNGKLLGTLWCAPYRLNLGSNLINGKNELKIEVTGTWYNRLVYDAGQPEAKRKTWTINGPSKSAALRSSGLIGPVSIKLSKDL